MRKRTVIALLTACSFAVCAVPVVSGNIVMAEVQDFEENTDGNMYFSSLNAEEVNIKDAGTYTVRLKAKEGWQFDVADHTDVTGWFVNEAGESAFTNTSGIAMAVNGEDFELDITIDASKIEGFSTNGSADLYVMPTGGIPLVVEGDNHGQYVAVSEKAGLI